jgi:hypothetical protein
MAKHHGSSAYWIHDQHMAETPDFDQLARTFMESVFGHSVTLALAEQLRQVWNARGAAEVDPVIREAHERLDRAGVPKAEGHVCDDPTCETKLGHRIKLLIAERDELRKLLDTVPPGT